MVVTVTVLLQVTERAKLNLEVENVQLKEELSDLITQLNSHKESNFKLKLVVEESFKKIKAKTEDISNMQITVEAETRTVAEQLLRHQVAGRRLMLLLLLIMLLLLLMPDQDALAAFY